ncbi:MAG TPA: hypothetical protein VNG32_02010, partial [Candidatus Dormibacteraeota bacterium]|nr:hypothetical protein [Candidatus Dormibacteraeota bacterium]
AVKEANDSEPAATKPVIVDSAKVTEAPAPDPNATALGANPSPSSVIPPVPGDSGEDNSPETETVAEAPEPEEPKPSITPAASAVSGKAAAKEPGADLNGIAL